MLNYNELQELYEKICDEIFKNIAIKNRTGGLNDYISKMGMRDLLNSQDKTNPYIELSTSKILIVGDSSIATKEIDSLIKEMNMPKDCYDVVPFSDSKHFKFKQLQYQEKYSDVLFGPISHSNTSKGDYSSVINMMQKEEGYPKIVVLTANRKLKISKNSLRVGIQETRLYQHFSSFY